MLQGNYNSTRLECSSSASSFGFQNGSPSSQASKKKKKKTAAQKGATKKPSAKSPSKRRQPSKLISQDGLAPLKRKLPAAE